MNRLSIFKEFLAFVRARKRWLLLPLVLFLLVLGFIFVTLQGSALAPFIYSLF
jgi:hypothetical protein